MEQPPRPSPTYTDEQPAPSRQNNGVVVRCVCYVGTLGAVLAPLLRSWCAATARGTLGRKHPCRLWKHVAKKPAHPGATVHKATPCCRGLLMEKTLHHFGAHDGTASLWSHNPPHRLSCGQHAPCRPHVQCWVVARPRPTHGHFFAHPSV